MTFYKKKWFISIVCIILVAVCAVRIIYVNQKWPDYKFEIIKAGETFTQSNLQYTLKGWNLYDTEDFMEEESDIYQAFFPDHSIDMMKYPDGSWRWCFFLAEMEIKNISSEETGPMDTFYLNFKDYGCEGQFVKKEGNDVLLKPGETITAYLYQNVPSEVCSRFEPDDACISILEYPVHYMMRLQ